MRRNDMLKHTARRLKTARWMMNVKLHPGTGKKLTKQVLLFDTSIESQNMGDVIIKHYCSRVLSEMFDLGKAVCVPTHVLPEEDALMTVSRAGTKIVCGTNLITPHFEAFSNWKMPEDLNGYRDIVTLGVGWGYYSEDISRISKFVYRTILSRNKLHSVRDSYTERKFKEMGITNVVNTGCPTLWGLTAMHCASIPRAKAKRVITTLTDYARDKQSDRLMIEILKENYDEVYIWIQGAEDNEYLQSLVEPGCVKVIERNLNSYTQALCMGDVDYVGTRLHAGVHAMNMGIRTIIIAVDNRAIEMGRDFHLPVIKRTEIRDSLLEWIYGEWETSIELPLDEISAWKQQFD